MAWRSLIAALGLVVVGSVPNRAQQRLSNQCPLIVPPEKASFQPRRIQPSQVQAKNAMGCLSPSDALYGPDGCPTRLCGPGSSTFLLPAE
ncbi:MAG: hypothetical protein VKK98_06760 [Cyanobacteriota bacterium]|nr:hypothetical protein [Cyanobacteriota bacterium]